MGAAHSLQCGYPPSSSVLSTRFLCACSFQRSWSWWDLDTLVGLCIAIYFSR
ncbi:hypothetical protein BHE74_00006869 [Ensete ventricosum]|uniref:Uncharacterized protein n=1 Tax=Ensete ventricosum TaxID=4639 RepID=A0A444E558_ENSVE|nr:hypothetical protein B296_00023135 [Ensete ventricosum]RWW05551.1 hypothetical protein GW17_00031172 [Ensete ventricosum]RWW84519.1 hypothetical protein BHE74_00006869 [Ensete ventricosum]